MFKVLICLCYILVLSLPVAAHTAADVLICQANCSTQHKAPDADEIGNCFASDLFEISLKVDGSVRGGVWRSYSGWDGDQFLSQSFLAGDIEKLGQGLTIITGLQQEGFNHGPDFISEYDINCHVK